MEYNFISEKEYGTLKICDNNDERYPLYIQMESNTGEFVDIELDINEVEDLIGGILEVLNLEKYRK